jgi:hypothetical protein
MSDCDTVGYVYAGDLGGGQGKKERKQGIDQRQQFIAVFSQLDRNETNPLNDYRLVSYRNSLHVQFLSHSVSRAQVQKFSLCLISAVQLTIALDCQK